MNSIDIVKGSLELTSTVSTTTPSTTVITNGNGLSMDKSTGFTIGNAGQIDRDCGLTGEGVRKASGNDISATIDNPATSFAELKVL